MARRTTFTRYVVSALFGAAALNSATVETARAEPLAGVRDGLSQSPRTSNGPIDGVDALITSVSIADLVEMAGEFVINGAPAEVATRATPEGALYAVITDGATGFQLVASGLGPDATGERFAAFQLFTLFEPAAARDPQFIQKFNRTVKHAKLTEIRDGAILSVEPIVAGGVSRRNIAIHFTRFFFAVDQLNRMADNLRREVRAGGGRDPLSLWAATEAREAAFAAPLGWRGVGREADSGAAALRDAVVDAAARRR